MPQLRLYIYWRDCHKLWEETRGTQKTSRIHWQQNVHTVRSNRQGSRNELVGHNRSCSERKSCHKLVRCQNFGKRRTSENQAGLGIDLDPERTQLDEQRWRGVYSLRPTAYDRLLVTCSTSRDHKPDKARSWRAKRRN